MSDAELAGLYLHVPFCAAICPYCDFAVARGDDRACERFAAAMIAEARACAGALAGAFDTLYLGGGTPSSLATAQLASILRAVRDALPIASDAFTISSTSS